MGKVQTSYSAQPTAFPKAPTGIAGLDQITSGGLPRGRPTLVCASLAAYFVDAACRRGERCLYLSFEESPGQLMRNMRSIGLNLAPWETKEMLRFHSTRPSAYGLEMHLATLHKLVQESRPRMVQITAVCTSLTHGGAALEATQSSVSSLIDTWLLVRDIESRGERNRGIYVLKSRGMAHSNQIREFVLTDRGVELLDVDVGREGVLVGSQRREREARRNAPAKARGTRA